MPLWGGDFRLQNVFGHKICRILPMRGGILFASTDVVHRPRCDSTLYFDIRNTWQIRTPKYNASARRLPPAALLQRWLQVCCVKRSCLHYYRQIVSFPQQRIRCNALWTGFHWESTFAREMSNPTLGFLVDERALSHEPKEPCIMSRKSPVLWAKRALYHIFFDIRRAHCFEPLSDWIWNHITTYGISGTFVPEIIIDVPSDSAQESS